MSELHLIFNPASNNGKNYHAFCDIEKYMKYKKIKYFLHSTKYPGDAKNIVRKLTTGNNKIVKIISIGGDGTLHEIINGINDFEKCLIGVIPVGRGNDFFSNIKSDRNSLLELIDKYSNSDKWKFIDFININNKIRCINSFGFGIDSYIIKECKEKRKSNYKFITIKKCLFFSVNECAFNIDNSNQEFHERTIVFVISKGKWFGGGIQISKNSQIDDGYLTISYIRKLNRLFTIPGLFKLLKYGGYVLKQHKEFKCKKIKLTIDKKFYQCDGELYEDTNLINASVVSNKLKIII